MVRAAPPQLAPAEGTGEVSPVTFRIRAFATPRYTAEVVDAPRQFQEAVDETNRVFSGIGVTFRVDSFSVWEPPDEEVTTALAALKAREPGHDSEWCVGLLGSLPRASASFHELGYAYVLGRHLVVRAPARADEVDDIERGFDEIAAADRERLTKSRRRHRASALLLHELGHTLGALHDDVAASLMNPAYANDRSGFSPQNAGLMQTTARHRGAKETDDRGLANELLQRLDGIGGRGDFVAKDREEMRVLLTELSGASRATPAAPVAAPRPAAPPPSTEFAPDDLHGLSDSDREIFRIAKETLAKGDAARAWETGKPLFSRYPTSYSTQDLRCQIAMAKLPFEKARPECDPVMRLSRAPGSR